MRRTRFHQSWYRARFLGLPRWGSTPGAQGSPLGSVLHPDDAAAGHNFTSSAAREMFEARRMQGWGVDPVRCTNLLTSSQALTLNLFGPLAAEPASFINLLNVVTGRSDVLGVEDVRVEFAPRRRSEHLNDMTRLDVLVYAKTAEGLLPVVFEVKYADRFNSRKTPTTTDPYMALAHASGIWSSDHVLGEQRFNQLLRCHALAASVGAIEGAVLLPVLVVIHHAADTATACLVDDYRDHVSDASLVQRTNLCEFVAAMGSTADGLRERYCDMDASESDWLQFADT